MESIGEPETTVFDGASVQTHTKNEEFGGGNGLVTGEFTSTET